MTTHQLAEAATALFGVLVPPEDLTVSYLQNAGSLELIDLWRNAVCEART